MRLRCAVAGTALALLALTGCTSTPATEPSTSSAPEPEARSLTVAAAASLQNAFTEIGDLFEEENPGVTLEFNFAGSSTLVTQLEEGAPGDVFASADQKNMDAAIAADLVDGEAPLFARNTLEIVTPPDNPAGIETFADLAGEGVDLVICAAQVPCGAATVSEAEAAGVTLSPVSEEQSVTDALGRVTSGEAEAGLVYVTDATAAGDAVERISFDTAVINDYPIGTLAAAADPELAAAFVDFVLSDEGQAILAEYGFLAP